MKMPAIRPVKDRAAKTVRQHHTYRAARREEQKQRYRASKKTA